MAFLITLSCLIPSSDKRYFVRTNEFSFQPKDKKVKFIDTHFDESGTKEHDKKTDSKLKEKNKRPNKVEEKDMEKEEDSGSETDEPGESSEEGKFKGHHSPETLKLSC